MAGFFSFVFSVLLPLAIGLAGIYFAIDFFEWGARYNILDIFHGEETHDFKVWSTDYTHILLRDDYERLLTVSGFSDIDFYGTYRFDPYDKGTSDLLIAIANK